MDVRQFIDVDAGAAAHFVLSRAKNGPILEYPQFIDLSWHFAV